jgi:hypothetical protein
MSKKLYDWNNLFSQGEFTMIQGKDFPEKTLPHGVAQQVRNAAVARGVKVSIEINRRGLKVTVHASN